MLTFRATTTGHQPHRLDLRAICPTREFKHQQDEVTRFEAGNTGVEHLFMRPQNPSRRALDIRLDIKQPPARADAQLGCRPGLSREWYAQDRHRDHRGGWNAFRTRQRPNLRSEFARAACIPQSMTAEAEYRSHDYALSSRWFNEGAGLNGVRGSFDHLRIEMRFSFSRLTLAEPPAAVRRASDCLANLRVVRGPLPVGFAGRQQTRLKGTQR